MTRLAENVLNSADEKTTAAAVAAYASAAAVSTCQSARKYLDWLVGDTTGRRISGFTLYPGDRIALIVERLDAAGSAVNATWRFELSASTPDYEWPASNERSWLVAETARSVIDMARFAAKKPRLQAPVRVSDAPRAMNGLAYTLVYPASDGKPRQTELLLADHIWSPAGYQALAAQELAGLPRRRAPETASTVLSKLLDPRSPVLAAESVRLSARLATDVLDVGAHEEAALLLGVFALREAAGPFSDTRAALCRMAAHLAIARELRAGTASRTAALGDALLLTLVSRQREALAAIAEIEAAQPEPAEAELLAAMRLRITTDWRVLKKPETASLLLRLEQYRAVETSLGASHALKLMESFEPEPLSDWARVAAGRGFSVEQGNVLAGSAIDLELKDLAATWQVQHGSALPDSLVAALAEPSRGLFAGEDSPVPQVIGWGLWAAFFQRNLCFEAEASVRFLDRMLGLRDEAAARQDELRNRLSKLMLWPAVELKWVREAFGSERYTAVAKYHAAACSRAAEQARNAPQSLPPLAWERLRVCSDEKASRALPAITEWLDTVAPPGTGLYDPARFTAAASSRPENDAAALRGLNATAPFDRALIAMQPDERAPEKLRARYGPLVDYDLRAMEWLAAVAPDEEAVRLYTTMATVLPQKYFALGHVLLELDREEEAAAAYEKAIETVRDRVLVANGVQWLVGYYCDHGRLDRARAVAEMAADVYSADGLSTMGYLMERLGRYSDAEAWYRRVKERYDSEASLDSFYIRHEQRVGDGRYRELAADALKKLFPDGLRRVSLSELEGNPEVAIGPAGSKYRFSRFYGSARFGLREGDIVVAVNGYAVKSHRHYVLIRTFDDRQEATIIVWRDGGFLEIKGILRNIRYGAVSGAI